MILIGCWGNCIIGRLGLKNWVVMIIGLLKMRKCMMLKGIKYQDLEGIDILVPRKIYLGLERLIEGKYLLRLRKVRHRSGKLSIRNILGINKRLTSNYCKKSLLRRKLKDKRIWLNGLRITRRRYNNFLKEGNLKWINSSITLTILKILRLKLKSRWSKRSKFKNDYVYTFKIKFSYFLY